MDKLIQAEMRLAQKRVATLITDHYAKYVKTKIHAEKFLTGIWPLRYFLLVQGQFPFAVTDFSVKKARSPGFDERWMTFMNLFHLLAFTFGFFNFAMLSFGYFSFFTGFNHPQLTVFQVLQEDLENLGSEIEVPKDWEKETIRRSFVFLVMVYLWFLQFMLVNVGLFIRRGAFRNYLNYWLNSFQIMEMTVAKDTFFRVSLEIFLAIAVMMILVIISFSSLFPIVTNMLDAMSYLYLRQVHYYRPDFLVPIEVIQKDTSALQFYVYKIPGIIILAQAYIGARSSIIHFIFYTRLLVDVSKTWNQRLRDSLRQNEVAAGLRDTPTGPKVRLRERLVLDDHFNIVQLYKMTEDLFGFQLIAYYFLQTLAMVFQLNHLVSVYSAEQVIDDRYDDNPNALGIYTRRLNLTLTTEEYVQATGEFYLATVAVALSLGYVYVTTKAAHDAYSEGMGGFQVLRRHCYLGIRDTTNERNLIHSLIVSFAKNNPIIFSANGYFDVDLSMMQAVVLNMMGYLVAAYTLKVDTTTFWNFGQYANLCRPPDQRAVAEGICTGA